MSRRRDIKGLVQAVGEALDGEHFGDSAEPGGEFNGRDEDPRDEVERQDDRLHDRLRCVGGADERRKRVAEDAEGDRADDGDKGNGGDRPHRKANVVSEASHHEHGRQYAERDGHRAERPAGDEHDAGTGVTRRRLRTPDSRWAVIDMTRLTKEDEITARAARPGTK